jgi:hypothetical protein
MGLAGAGITNTGDARLAGCPSRILYFWQGDTLRSRDFFWDLLIPTFSHLGERVSAGRLLICE